MKHITKKQKALGAAGNALLVVLFMAVFAFGFVPLALDGMEKESQWRQDRLCRIYEVCTPEQGP